MPLSNILPLMVRSLVTCVVTAAAVAAATASEYLEQQQQQQSTDYWNRSGAESDRGHSSNNRFILPLPLPFPFTTTRKSATVASDHR
jgi:hypothetical protein